MSPLLWIVLSGLLMSAVALVGGLTLLFGEKVIRRLQLPLVAFSAGSLLGGAFFHMLPAATQTQGVGLGTFESLMLGFGSFFALEQLLHFHHCRRATAECRQPLTYLILIGDGLHNFVGGMAVAGTFLVDVRLGITTWLAAAAHEVPQELGDFGVLLHAGWSPRKALMFNMASALTFLLGGLVAYTASFQLDIAWLIPFAAGNFIYIAASDLVPEVHKHSKLQENALNLASFAAGAGLLYLTKLALH